MKKNELSLYCSRGIRNNNPFNIKRSHDTWKGSVPQSEAKDPTFVVFADIHFGIRAGIILLRNYIANGIDTVDKIIQRYAPPSENFTSYYIGYVDSFVNQDDVPFSAPIPYGLEEPRFYALCYSICKYESEFNLTMSLWRKVFGLFPELNKPL